MSEHGDHPSGLEVRSVRSGFVAEIHHGDGTSTGYWGQTEQAASDRAVKGAL